MTDQELSFDESNAQSGPTICSRCEKPLTEYWAVDGAVVCESCKDEILAEVDDPSGATGRVFKAIGLGLLGMLGGAIVWYAVARFADLQIGVIAILLGWLVAKGIMVGTGGRGGLGYQILAVAITYLGIGVALTPLVVEDWLKKAQVSADSLMTAADSLPGMMETPADSLRPTGRLPEEQGLSDSALDAELAALDSTIAAGGKAGAEPPLSGAAILAGLLAALLAALLVALVLPVGVVLGGSFISGIIFAIALYQAWKLTAKVEKAVSGPHPVGAPA